MSKPREFWVQYYSSIDGYVFEEPSLANKDYLHFKEVTPQDAKFREAFEMMMGALKRLSNESNLQCETIDGEMLPTWIDSVIQKAQEAKKS